MVLLNSQQFFFAISFDKISFVAKKLNTVVFEVVPNFLIRQKPGLVQVAPLNFESAVTFCSRDLDVCVRISRVHI